jgi:hypothetical protein
MGWSSIRSISTLRSAANPRPSRGELIFTLERGRQRFVEIVDFGALIKEVRFAVDSPLEEAGFEPSVPLYGQLGALGLVRRTRAAIVSERPIVRVDAPGERFAAPLGMEKAELEIGFGDFGIWRRLCSPSRPHLR